MNAYELADDLESYDWYYEHQVTGSDGYTQEIKTCNTGYVWDAANMLRQQADRIAELEKLVSDMTYEKSSGVYEHSIKQLNDEEIANLWLFLEGKSEGVLQLGGTFNFPVEFYKAIKELEK